MTWKNKLFSIPLYLQILIGMVAGIAIGLIALWLGGEQFIQSWIRPWGRIFIRLLQLIAVPLVFISLVKGVIGLGDIKKFSHLGGRTLVFYIATTILAVGIGLTAGLVVKPGSLVDKSQVEHIRESYQSFADEKKQEAQAQSQGPLAFLDEIVPDNIVGAAANNSKMLQIIFFAVFFAVAALTIPSEKVKPVVFFFDSLYDIILRMVDYIIRMAPYGVAALMAGLVIDFNGDASVFAALGAYAVTVAASLLFLILVVYPIIIHFLSRIPVKKFLKAMYPVQLFAFTTSSSAATLPVTMEAVQKDLGVSKETTSFVLPVGVTINMDGTSCYQAIAVLFIAQVLGISLGFRELLTILLMTILSSIGTPGIPGGSYVILAMVLTSVGIPAEGLALILGIDRPLDMMRTAVNVTGDAAIATIVDKK